MTESKYQGFSAAHTEDGTVTAYVYRGSRAEIEELASGHHIGETGAAGRLISLRVSPHDGPVWQAELRYEASDDWQSIAAPDKSWGKRFCRLHGAMLSRPLAAHPRYRASWDHYLAAFGSAPLPGWWSSAASTVISGTDRNKYRWIRSTGELPLTGLWRVLKAPTKPGVTSFAAAAYSVTETARFRSASAAGNMVSRLLNRIGTPSHAFGITGGNWRCDNAEVSWDGRCWIAKLDWTHDANGWDTDLYDADRGGEAYVSR